MANFSEQQIRAMIRDELRQIFGGNQSQQQIQFLPTTEAYKVLGFNSPQQLRDACRSGLLRLGKGYQDRRHKDRLTKKYYFNIPACIKRLNESPEKRA